MNSARYSLASRYDNPIPSWFLAPIDCLKIPALDTKFGGVDSWAPYKFKNTASVFFFEYLFDVPFLLPEMSPSDVLHSLTGVGRAKQDPKIIDNLVIFLYWK